MTQLLLYLCNPALMISSLALPFDVQLFKQGARWRPGVSDRRPGGVNQRTADVPGGQGRRTVRRRPSATPDSSRIPLVSQLLGEVLFVLFNDLFNGHAAVCLDGRTDADH